MYRSMGMDRRACAKFLHVSERTLHNWETGRHAIPYTAYKLLRLHCRHELPGKAWRGWLIHSGKLWTPEGHGLTPADAAHWYNLSRRAQLAGELFKENAQLKERLRAAAGGRRHLYWFACSRCCALNPLWRFCARRRFGWCPPR